ncbi:MAG: TetR/AcrR family transcriptional regulator [Defluviitaleaceae bacterium]|nr:TetR/AcrR family transcriptional regulator [Defluviitaleaceae bacterium]
MEKFFTLRAEKQEHIINAALHIFGRNGYKKASIADIASDAGIAKGMVLYYFGSKKNLYLYLADLCGRIIKEEFRERFDNTLTDFFDRIKMATEIKVSMMKKHTHIISFLASMYVETDKEVLEDVAVFKKGAEGARGSWMFDGIEVSRFKDDVDPELISRFLVWAGEGFGNAMPLDLSKMESMEKLDEFMRDFYNCLDLMKKYFYKEEV